MELLGSCLRNIKSISSLKDELVREREVIVVVLV